MARLGTWGFETQTTAAYAECVIGGGGGGGSFQGATITTTNPRSGLAAASCAADGQVVVVDSLGGTLDRGFFARAYMRFSSVAPTNPVKLFSPWDGVGGHTFGVWLETNGTLTLKDATGTQIGSASDPLVANVYYRIEHEWKVATGGGANSTLGLYLALGDGPSTRVARSTTANAGSTGKTEVDLGRNSGTATLTILIDDVAVNDDTAGGKQTGLPGPGKIVLLKPISDNSRTGFTGGGGGTTNLFDANNNYGPTGVISPGTNATQNGSATNNATDNYQLNLGAFNTAVGSGGGGLTGNETVTLVQALARASNSTTTSRNFGLTGVSNPAIGEVTTSTDTTAGGTEPTGWTTLVTPFTLAPAVTLGTSPVLKFRKATASTDRINCDMMGLVVEYAPASLVVPRPRHRNLAIR